MLDIGSSVKLMYQRTICSKYILFILFLLGAGFVYAGDHSRAINPRDYGVERAKTGEERYQILYRCHSDAVKKSLPVSYCGIDTIKLDIPSNAKSIPLTDETDFAGTVICILNTQKDNFYLFEMKQKTNQINVGKNEIDKGDFLKYPQLKKGLHLLLIKDENLWVDNRIGHSYGHFRNDVLLVKDGRSVNKVVSPYNNSESNPSCQYCNVSTSQKVFGNGVFVRNKNCTKVCNIVKVENQNNVLFHDVKLFSPSSSLGGDRAFRIDNCSNVTIKDVYVRGTYSNNSGYAFSFNNLWNTRFVNVDADASWGVVGTNNMNNIEVKRCVLNRFDVHCYGRDILFDHCTIRKSEREWYCGGSSIFGQIKYKHCRFYNTSPYANGDSYKTYVPVHLVFENCKFYVSAKKCAIISTANFSNDLNPRKNLSVKHLPSVTIKNMSIYVPKGVRSVYLYHLGKDMGYKGQMDYNVNVTIKGLKIVSEDHQHPAQFLFSNASLFPKEKVSYKSRRLKVS